MNRGFTLLEMLVAVAILAMIAGMLYTALGMAGDGFKMLSERRDTLALMPILDRQLRLDTACVSVSHDRKVSSVVLNNDQRGDVNYDELILLVREAGTPSLMQVRYYIDEEKKLLIREEAMPWARAGVEPLRWEMGDIVSFSVEAMDDRGEWKQSWSSSPDKSAGLPKALKVIFDNGNGPREWWLPVAG